MKRRLVFIFTVMALLLTAAAAHALPPQDLLQEDTVMHRYLEKRFTGDLPQMEARTAIRVGTVYSQTNFFFFEGQKRGFEFSLVDEYASWLNAQLKKQKKPPVTMVYILLDHNEMLEALNEGRVDMVAAGLTITDSRRKKVAFSTPYLTNVRELVVTNKAVQGLKTLDDLAGRKVYVRRSASYYGSLTRLNKTLKSKGLKPMEVLPVDESLATEDILEMLNAGIIDITVADSHLADLWSQVLPDIVVHEDLAVRRGGELAWAVRKQDKKFKASLDAFMATHKKGTKLGNIFFNRYFKDTKWVTNPGSPEKQKQYAELRKWFYKYGKMYNIDPLLVAAQAFVESGFDPNAQSHVGAIGVMQLMPDLAKDKRVGITDLQDTESNIHAGVKYLALIRDQYFSDLKLSPDEQVRFALAAYNAGPTRMSRIRKMAQDMGYNPDIWFLESEVATQQKVSTEPVRYVRKINVVYVAYKLALQSDYKRTKVKEHINEEAGKK